MKLVFLVNLDKIKIWINGSHAPIISESAPSSRHPEGQSGTHRNSREKFHHTKTSREGFTTSIDQLLGTSTPSWVITRTLDLPEGDQRTCQLSQRSLAGFLELYHII
ncbi:hypothetical protein LXL04_004339 [Taraxacum kok-saghyz]